MWSPIGTANAAKYYPGPHYVDYVGCSVWKLENRSFAKTFAPVYQTLAQYGKPIIIAEFGVQAKDDQAAWVAGLKASASQFPLLKSVIYFNAVDPHPWVNGQVQARRAYAVVMTPLIVEVGEVTFFALLTTRPVFVVVSFHPLTARDSYIVLSAPALGFLGGRLIRQPCVKRHVLGEHVLQHRSYEAPWFSGSFLDDHGDAPLSGDFQLGVGLFHPAKEVELPSWQNDGPSDDEVLKIQRGRSTK
jgi:hypothetical protein